MSFEKEWIVLLNMWIIELLGIIHRISSVVFVH